MWLDIDPNVSPVAISCEVETRSRTGMSNRLATNPATFETNLTASNTAMTPAQVTTATL